MSADRNADRIVRAWLDLMPEEAPDRMIAAVLQAVETAPQVRRPLVRAPWRTSPMTRFALIAAVAALGAALFGGALLIGGSRNDTPTPTTAPVVPAPSASPTAAPSAPPAPEALRGNWLADRPDSTGSAPAGDYLRMVINASGQSAWVPALGGTQRLRSTATSTGSDELALSLNAAISVCPAGSTGRYRWEVSADRLLLTLTAVDEPCAPRADAFARTWTRTHAGFSDGGTAVVPDVGPLFQVTLPDGTYATRPMKDAQEIFDASRDYILYAWKNPQGFASACSLDERYPWTPGAQAFVDYIEQSDAFVNVRTEVTTVGGYPAIHLTFDSVPSYPACPGAQWLEQLVPKDSPDGGWHIGFGEPDAYWVVDHPDATLLFQVLPVSDVSAAEVIGSITFPDGLATTAP